MVRRISGFVFLGLIPCSIWISCFELYPLFLNDASIFSKPFLYWSAAMFLFIFITVITASKQPGHLQKYPQIRMKEWSTGLLLLNILSWALHLLAYETLFRGILLFSLIPEYGTWAAIAINGLLYSLAHLPKGWKETLGSFPFAVLLCLASVDTGSVWLAFIIHVTLAVSNDLVAIKKQPDMEFKPLSLQIT